MALAARAGGRQQYDTAEANRPRRPAPAAATARSSSLTGSRPEPEEIAGDLDKLLTGQAA